MTFLWVLKILDCELKDQIKISVKRKFISWTIRLFWIGILSPILVIIGGVWFASMGWFGPLPTFEELENMSKTDLQNIANKLKNELSFNNKNYLAINDDLGIKLKQFTISKNSNDTPFLLIQGEIDYFISGVSINADISYYISQLDENIFIFDGWCLVKCSKYRSNT